MLGKAKAKATEAKAAAKAQSTRVRRSSVEGGVELSFLEHKEIDASIAPRNITHQGWLQKAGGADGKKGKKKRYFTVGDFALAYYEKELSDAKGGAAGESALKHIKGTVDLTEASEVGPSDSEPFEINVVCNDGRLLRLFCESELDRKEWLAAIEAFTGYSVGRAANLARLQDAAKALSGRLQALADGTAATMAAAQAAPAGVEGIFPVRPGSITGAEVGSMEKAAADVSTAKPRVQYCTCTRADDRV
jgi:hypothetical protein